MSKYVFYVNGKLSYLILLILKHLSLAASSNFIREEFFLRKILNFSYKLLSEYITVSRRVSVSTSENT